MQAPTMKEKINLSHAKAIRRARELLKITRADLASRLGLTSKAIEKYENGRAQINEEKLLSILDALKLNNEQYQKIRKGKSVGLIRKEKKVLSNLDRRSYKRIMTKEVRVLKYIRETKNLTQDQASALCGYSRPSVGHIENGRIELDQTRINHILNCYGATLVEFEVYMSEGIYREEILNECLDKIKILSEEKLKLLRSLLNNF